MNFDFLKGLLGKTGGAAGAAGGGGGILGGLGSYFSGKPFSPTPGPGAPGAPPGPNLGGSAADFIGRLNNSINPISLLLGLGGHQPNDRYRPLWKPAQSRPSNSPPSFFDG